jgi:hypothetical protein
MDYINELEARLNKITEGISVLPGVVELLDSIPTEDWTINTANSLITATERLSQFNLHVPKQMMTGCKVINQFFFFFFFFLTDKRIV